MHRFDTKVSNLFFMKKGDFLPICNFPFIYFKSNSEFLEVRCFDSVKPFNDYLTIYTITMRVFLSRVEIPYDGKWRIINEFLCEAMRSILILENGTKYSYNTL